MNWSWPTSLDQLWRSPAFPMWLTLAAAAFFGVIVLVTLVRAEKSVANGALTVITLLAVGVALAATIRGFDPDASSAEVQTPQQMNAALPALSCMDDLAGEVVLTGCEKALFGSAESAAAAVSYAASQITRLTAAADAAPDGNMTPEMQALRRAVEHDRYGLIAQMLLARDHCTPAECAAFRVLTDHQQIAANMEARVYDGLVSRFAASWNAPAPAAGAVAALSPTMPTGRPTNAEFPSAASTPPVSIMTPEPGLPPTPAVRSAAPAPPASAPLPSPRPAPALVAAKRPAAPKSRAASAPVQIAPTATAPSAASTD